MYLNQVIYALLRTALIGLLGLTFACSEAPEVNRVSLALEHSTILTADSLRPVIHDGLILVNGTQLVFVGEAKDAPAYEAAHIIDAKQRLITPGWVNTHGHAAMSLFRGMADDMPLTTWLQEHIWPAEAAIITPEAVRAGTRLAIAEMLSHGVTTFADMYFFEEEVAKAADELGIRVMIGEGILMFPTPAAAGPAESLVTTVALARRWKDHPRVFPSVAPHSPYALTSAQLRSCDSLARALGIPLQIHLSETRQEVVQSQDSFGMSPVARLANLGLLGDHTLAAHCVHLNEEDIALLAAKHVAVAHCPESNLKLGSGIAPIPALLREGVTVGAGTDGAASNNNLDLHSELRTGNLVQKGVNENPALLTAEDWFRIGTIGGAQALGLGDRIGSLQEGKEADLLMYDLTSAQTVPLYDELSHLMYALDHRDLQLVIVAGQRVWENGHLLTADAGRIIEEAREIADNIRKLKQ